MTSDIQRRAVDTQAQTWVREAERHGVPVMVTSDSSGGFYSVLVRLTDPHGTYLPEELSIHILPGIGSRPRTVARRWRMWLPARRMATRVTLRDAARLIYGWRQDDAR